jgi:hypothetical protein
MNLLLVMSLAIPADHPHDDMSRQEVEHVVPAPSDWVLVRGHQEQYGKLDGEAPLEMSGGRLRLCDGGHGELVVKGGGGGTGLSVTCCRSGLINLSYCGNPLPGIYQYDGDRLTVCVGQREERPTDCATHPGDGRLFLVFKRNK